MVGINCTSAEMSIGEGGELDVYTYHHYDQYCGDVPPPVYSITNQLWIKYIQRAFNLSPDWTIASFEAVYKSELRVRTSPCTISSPGYPDNYPRHFARSWSIIAPEGKEFGYHKLILIMVRTLFTMAAGYWSPACIMNTRNTMRCLVFLSSGFPTSFSPKISSQQSSFHAYTRI